MASRYKYLVLSTITFIACSKPTIEGDTLFRGGFIIDGTGSEGYYSDIIIGGDSIVWIGSADRIKYTVANEENIGGKIITPGFVDLHAHGDPVHEQDFKNFLAQGVTSICLGMDGSNATSTDMIEWLRSPSSSTYGINILPFAGHGSARILLGLTDVGDLTEDEIKDLCQMIETVLSMGCWGVSMGLEYLPGYYAGDKELVAIARTVGKHNGLITSHIRNEDDDMVDQSIREMGALASYCRTNISHIKVVFGRNIDRADQLAALLDEFDLTADLYPYTASYTGIGIVFPNWAKNPKQYENIKKTRAAELAAYLKQKVESRGGPTATLFGTAPHKGRTLAEIAEAYNMPYELVLRDIIGPYGGSAAYFVMNEDIQHALLKNERVMVSSDGSPSMYHPRGYGSQARIIEKFVVNDNTLSIEQAIHKMSGQVANILQLNDRGIIRIGTKADLAIFSPNEIKANADFSDPHQLASGMKYVYVNGRRAYDQGDFLDKQGRLILKDLSTTK